jgi:S1-C subfamily serine protease/predicted esterase
MNGLYIATVALALGRMSAGTGHVDPVQHDSTGSVAGTVIDRVAPSVVLIETTGGSERVGKGDRLVRRGTGPTTGVVVAADGYVITSAFNFANRPTAITVSVPGRKERFLGKVVATDHSRLLTLLKIDATDLPVPQPVPGAEVRIGQTAIALGRTLDQNPDHSPSVSVGIVSATQRIWGRCLQTDAKVSPVNYGGPLVAGDGRVLGILVPASPTGDGETAGFEWYDSGIGFAVPFDHVLQVLPRLRAGKDLRRGLLGIRPKGDDQYSVAPTITTVSPESPAAKAGIKPGDVVVAVDGHPVVNHAQMLHRLGPKYDGDTVSIKVKRGDEELAFDDLVLMGGEPPYRHPFIGIAPVRDDPELGVAVRAVWPDSPAAVAKLQPGDRILKVKPPGAAKALPFSGRDQLLEALDAIPAGSEVQLEVKKGDKAETVTLKLAPLPETVPAQVTGEATAKQALAPRKQPPAERPPGLPGIPQMPGQPKEKDKAAPKKAAPKVEEKKEEPKKVETGLMTRPSPSRDREYWIYVPPNYDPNVSHALVVWLHAAGQGGKDAKDLVEIWRAACEQQHLILVGPKSNNDAGWLASEAEQVQEVAREVLGQYTIDRQRVIAHGLGVGGQMAYYLAFNARDLVRGAAVSGAALASSPRENLAGQRLSFFIVAGGKDPAAKDIAAAKPALNEKRFPVVFREVADMGKEYLDRPTFEELVRWIDSLDRL